MKRFFVCALAALVLAQPAAAQHGDEGADGDQALRRALAHGSAFGVKGDGTENEIKHDEFEQAPAQVLAAR